MPFDDDHHDSKRDFNRFEFVAQEVWSITDLAEKKRIIIEKMIDKFEFKGKADHFRTNVLAATTAFRLDKLVGDLVLIQSGDRVIK